MRLKWKSRVPRFFVGIVWMQASMAASSEPQVETASSDDALKQLTNSLNSFTHEVVPKGFAMACGRRTNITTTGRRVRTCSHGRAPNNRRQPVTYRHFLVLLAGKLLSNGRKVPPHDPVGVLHFIHVEQRRHRCELLGSVSLASACRPPSWMHLAQVVCASSKTGNGQAGKRTNEKQQTENTTPRV